MACWSATEIRPQPGSPGRSHPATAAAPLISGAARPPRREAVTGTPARAAVHPASSGFSAPRGIGSAGDAEDADVAGPPDRRDCRPPYADLPIRSGHLRRGADDLLEGSRA